MKKKLFTGVLIFLIFFTAFSEVLSVKKHQILYEWATDYINVKTAPQNDDIPDDARSHIMYEMVSPCVDNLVDNVQLIRDAPRSRIPILSVIDFYGKIFAIQVGMADNIIAYATQSGYWGEKTDELDILSEKTLEEVEESESYNQWRQHIKDEITTLHILPKQLWNTPEELREDILEYSLQEMPFFDRLFLSLWDSFSKEKAHTLYQTYQTHIKEDDLTNASADLFALYGIYMNQQKMREDINYFLSAFGEDFDFTPIIIFEIVTILLLSSAATCVVLLLLFYRKSPAVVGIPLGVSAVIVSSAYFTLGWFGLAGVAAVFLSYRYMIPLNYKKSALISLKAGFVLFLAHYVFNASLTYAGIIQSETGAQHLTDLVGGSLTGTGLYIGFQICLFCLLSVIGGLLAYMLLTTVKMMREESKQK